MRMNFPFNFTKCDARKELEEAKCCASAAPSAGIQPAKKLVENHAIAPSAAKRLLHCAASDYFKHLWSSCIHRNNSQP